MQNERLTPAIQPERQRVSLYRSERSPHSFSEHRERMWGLFLFVARAAISGLFFGDLALWPNKPSIPEQEGDEFIAKWYTYPDRKFK